MPFSIVRDDISRMQVDAVVVAANEQLIISGGVGATVAQAAGLSRVQDACDAIGGCPTGSAVVTPGFDLPARFIVHAVGPVWQDGERGERALLRSAYESALRCAADAGADSVAMPLISAGTFGFPAGESFSIALDAVKTFLSAHDMDVLLVLYNRAAVEAGLALRQEISEYIDDHYVEEHPSEGSSILVVEDSGDVRYDMVTGRRMRSDWGGRAAPPDSSDDGAIAAPLAAPTAPAPDSPRRGLLSRLKSRVADGGRDEPAESAAHEEALVFGNAPASMPAGAPAPLASDDLESRLQMLDASFSDTVLALIDARGLQDSQVYKRANMSRQLFSKMRGDAHYRPTKKTALALAIALELSLDETRDLLRRAGYALSNSSKADVIVEFFISRECYDIFAINEALYAFDQPLL